MPSRWRHCVAVLAVVSVSAWSSVKYGKLSFPLQPTNHIAVESEIDRALNDAATRALAGREGAIIVLDPQTGRARAVVNPQVAFENAYAPGSTIKPFTALAALRAGLIDKDSKALCRERYSNHGFATVCAHARDLPPFDPSQAIAYSCNYYFGRLGERLNEQLLSDTLVQFGFGKQAVSDNPNKQAGQLLRGKEDPRNSLGEGEHLQSTPMQLATAYAALVNGGHLFSTVLGSSGVEVHDRGVVPINPTDRSIIISGMRGAVTYGTAAQARLNTSSTFIFGKTGTSTPLRGFRSQGWFVGFAATSSTGTPRAEQVKLEVVVFLKRGHGSEAARVSREVFEEFDRWQDHWQDQIVTGSAVSDPNKSAIRDPHSEILLWTARLIPDVYRQLVPVSSRVERTPLKPITTIAPQNSIDTGRTVKVHLVTENVTKEIPFENYVATVVATEGSMEDQPEALKALAVAVRTFALKNAGRHAKDGYDFCSTTHCQRFQSASEPTIAKATRAETELDARVIAAVRATENEVLRDQNGALADSYFGASCGGMTANLQSLWGASAPSYLRGVRDDACAAMPHKSWTDTIPSEKLLDALRADERTNPGAHLSAIRIARRDATGRAETISIEGERNTTVRGWDFKIIVGRKLGWNFLKSSRFEVTRAGSNYIFRGSGFGHGLGLCQEGAHVMAQRGSNYQQILEKYFPGITIAAAADKMMANKVHADVLWNGPRYEPSVAHATGRAFLSSDHFRISYPTTASPRDVQRILNLLEGFRANLFHRVTTAGMSAPELRDVTVFINDSTGDFVGRTGLQWWAAAATKKNQIELQPIDILKRRGVLETTLKHELVHAVVDKLSGESAPRWLAEGMAVYFSGEGPLVSAYSPKTKLAVEQIEAKLTNPQSADEMRRAYAAAYQEVAKLVRTSGESAIWRRVARAG